MSNLFQELSPISKGTLIILSLYIIYQIVQRSRTLHRHNSIIRKNGCKPVATYAHRDPILGLDLFLENSELSKTGGLWDRVRERYLALNCWTFSQLILGTRVITTAEPENIKAMLANQFREFELPPRRKEVRIFNCPSESESKDQADFRDGLHSEPLLDFPYLVFHSSRRDILTDFEDIPTCLWTWDLHYRRQRMGSVSIASTTKLCEKSSRRS
jgi:hypothetical protein